MKRSRFTEEQIIAVLREQEAGAKTTDVCRKHGVSEATFYKRKARCGGMEVSDTRRLKGARGRERQTEESARRGDAGQRHAAGRGGKKMVTPAARREAAADLGQVHAGEPAAGMPGDRRGPQFGGLPPPATR